MEVSQFPSGQAEKIRSYGIRDSNMAGTVPTHVSTLTAFGKDVDDVLDGHDDSIRVCCSSPLCTCRVEGSITKYDENTVTFPIAVEVDSTATISEANFVELNKALIHETPEKCPRITTVENGIDHADSLENTLTHVSKTFSEYFSKESLTITHEIADDSLIQLKMSELGGCRRKSRKRKQSKPKSLCKEEDLKFLADIDASGEVFDDDIDEVQELHASNSYSQSQGSIDANRDAPKQIKHKPLCSKLCISRKRKHKRCKRRPSVSSDKLISDIILKSLESKTAQHSTNRYRRHFLKQKHKAEERQKRVLETEHWDEKQEQLDERKEPLDEKKDDSIDLTRETDESSSAVNYSKDVGSDEDGVIECKPIRMNLSLEGTLECCICSNTFDDIGSLTAHYMCHNSLDKEHTNTKPEDSDGAPSEGPTDGHIVQSNPFPSFKIDMLGHSPNSDSRSGEWNKDGSWGTIHPTNDSNTKPNLDTTESSTYFCHICNQKFSDIITLQTHVTEHSMDAAKSPDSAREFYCYLCQKKFASAGSLHVHNKIHTGDNPYTCLTCQKTFRDKTRLTTHIRVHTGEKPYMCHICNKAFSQKGNLKLHQKIHTGERDSVCQTCGNTFRSKGDLLRHMKIHGQGESSDSSDTSSKQKRLFSEEGISASKDDDGSIAVSLNKYKETNDEKDCPSSQGMYQQSPIDFHAFFSMNKLKLEKPTIDDTDEDRSGDGKVARVYKQEEKDLMVSIDTEVEFIKAMTNAKVLAENSLTVSRSYMCPLCGLALTSFEAFNHHLLSSHNPHSMFSMPLGSLALNVSLPPELSAVHAHSPLLFPALRADDNLTGSMKKSYRCQECGQEFSSFPKFQIHMRSHTDMTDHVKNHVKDRVKDHVEAVADECRICNKQVSSDELQEHLKAHSEEKTYTCDFCCKTFRRSHHLQTHLRTHTGARPYTCTDCGKNFARGDHLQNHKRTHTGEKPYTCDICHKSYSQSHHLLRHKRTHTGERPYHCGMCDKTFSRDHHLKKHMETHNVLVFPDKLNLDNVLGFPDKLNLDNVHGFPDKLDTLTRQSTPKPSSTDTSSLMTQSSHSLPRLFLDSTSDNIASRLMESMVKRHLQDGIHSNQSHSNQSHSNQSHSNQSHGNQSHGNHTHGNQSHGNHSHSNQGHGNQNHGNQSHGNHSHGNQTHDDSPLIRERLAEKPLEKAKPTPSNTSRDTETMLKSVDYKKGNKVNKSRPLNITDILDDNFIPSSSQISGKLILHHMFNDTKSASLTSSPADQLFASKQVSLATSTDPDRMASNSPSDQGTHSLLHTKPKDWNKTNPSETIMKTKQRDKTHITEGAAVVIDYSQGVKKLSDQSRSTPTFEGSSKPRDKKRANDKLTFVDIVDQQLREEFRNIDAGNTEEEVDVAIENFRNIESGWSGREVNVEVAVGKIGNIDAGKRKSGTGIEVEVAGEGSKLDVEVAGEGSKVDVEVAGEGSKVDVAVAGEGSKVDVEVAGEGSKLDVAVTGEGSKVDVEVAGESSKVDVCVAVDQVKDNTLTLEDIVNQRLMEEYCVGDV